MLNTILYAGSTNPQTQDMLKILMSLPAFQKASLHILHVVPAQVSAAAFSEKWDEGGRIINDLLQEISIAPNKVSTMLRQGDPKDIVCQVANEINADLIIMGSRGLKRLEAILENSVSQYVFQLTDHPMLLVKDDIYVRTIKRVMVALDKSPAAEYALDLALFLLRDFPQAKLWLARVNPDLKKEFLPLSKTEIENNPIIASAIEKAKRMGVSYRCSVTGGRPGEGICALAEEENIDLLLLGSPDRRPSIAKSLPDLDRLLGTSLSDYVRVNAPCPVLLTRREI